MTRSLGWSKLAQLLKSRRPHTRVCHPLFLSRSSPIRFCADITIPEDRDLRHRFLLPFFLSLLLTWLFSFIVEATFVSLALGISPMSSGFMSAFCPSSCLEMVVEGAEYTIIWPDFNRYLGVNSHAYVFLFSGLPCPSGRTLP